MRSNLPGTLFLDFDGVICNSLEECFRSSWMVENPQIEPPADPAYRARFDACRPFIRSGEDYVVAHQWALKGETPVNQEAFDKTLEAVGAGALADLKTRLYTVRDDLLLRRRAEWLSWNPMYEGMGDALKAQSENQAVWILSTKKASFIGEILKYHGVSWPQERTVYTGTRRKLDLIDEKVPGMPSVLIDDQIDHLDFFHPSCRCYLALWGYASPEAIRSAPAALVLTEAIDLVRTFPRQAG